MRYLLDTHAYYWFRQSPTQLPARVLDLMTDVRWEILISPVIPWELAIKVGIGKLDAMELLVDFEQREVAAGFSMIPMTTAQVIRSGLLPSHHRDPFDRLLIAQSLLLGIPILSDDSIFDQYGVQRIWN
jgi:PIN domain nuclease of toxin-antitoxin system